MPSNCSKSAVQNAEPPDFRRRAVGGWRILATDVHGWTQMGDEQDEPRTQNTELRNQRFLTSICVICEICG